MLRKRRNTRPNNLSGSMTCVEPAHVLSLLRVMRTLGGLVEYTHQGVDRIFDRHRRLMYQRDRSLGMEYHPKQRGSVIFTDCEGKILWPNEKGKLT